ncbi:MAG: mercuric reductase [Gloeomargaritaceae cyanobacterium C42_A2020_066]|nr:mercuric reductase [Gloeomargaritaceae cyanobacterium C42_A2020_066]
MINLEDATRQTWLQHVRPADWVNPVPQERYHLVVVGGGPAGLVAAVGAAGLGAKVALVEKHWLGGDCLNTGCVPSKALLRPAHLLAEVRQAATWGLGIDAGRPDFGAVMARVRQVRADLSHQDSAARFQSLGMDVFLGAGRFTGPRTIEVAGQTLPFKRAVIATGSRPAVPEIPGLAEVPYLTHETIFELTERPARLGVIGGGPVGCELAQAFHLLGSQVCLIHHSGQLVPREDPEAAQILLDQLRQQGLTVHLNSQVLHVGQGEQGYPLLIDTPAGRVTHTVDAILVSAGRVPNVEGLGLEQAGVAYDLRQGVHVNDFLQTTHAPIYAAGDVCLPWKFTHAADAAARIVLQNALFAGRKRLSHLTVPRALYTDPEIAQVGLAPDELQHHGRPFQTVTVPMAALDRAATDGHTLGWIKVYAQPRSGRILGATAVGHQAGELIGSLTVAMIGRLGLADLAQGIFPYPTRTEVLRKLGDSYRRTQLTPSVKRLLRLWLQGGV